MSELRARLGHWLERAASGPIVITRRGRPVGLLVGFQTDADRARHSSARIHAALFPEGVEPKPLSALKEGLRERIRARHAGDRRV